MSMRAALRGTAARLIDKLDLPAPPAAGTLPHPMCGVQPNGRPPADMGQLYLAVHPQGVQGLDPDATSNDRGYALAVTITKKLREVPKDRRGLALCDDDGMWDFAERVADIIHQDDATDANGNSWLTEVNKLIPGTEEYVAVHGGSATVNGFCEALRFQTIQVPESAPAIFVGEDDGSGGDNGDPDDLLKLVVLFGGARRVRDIGS